MAKQPFTNDSKGRVVVFLPLKVKICLFRSHGGLAVKGVNRAPWTMVANGGKWRQMLRTWWLFLPCFLTWWVFGALEKRGVFPSFGCVWKLRAPHGKWWWTEGCGEILFSDEFISGSSGMLKPIHFRNHQSNSFWCIPLSLLVVSEKAGFRLAKFHLHSPNPWLDYSARIHLVAANGPF